MQINTPPTGRKGPTHEKLGTRDTCSEAWTRDKDQVSPVFRHWQAKGRFDLS